jgi:arylsulfatase A-like enzyme
MLKRPRIRLSTLSAVTLLLWAGSLLAEPAARPNILWVVSEDNSPFLGCYGDPYAVTPNLDRLAASGVMYTRAFATSPVCAPARFTLATGIYVNTAGTENMRSKNPVPEEILFLSNYLRAAGYYCTNNAKEDYNTFKPEGAWDESSNQATYRNRPAGQPFFHVQNFYTTHESRLHRGSEPGLHDPEDAPVPAYHPDLPVIRDDWAVYYDRVTDVDAEIGAFLEQVEADGLLEDTIVFYYSDHGGALARSKRFLFESGLRVPLIVHVPEKWSHLAPGSPGSSSDRLVTFVDLPPTVLSLAGADIPSHLQGSAFMGPQEGNPREYAYSLRGRMDERMDRSRSIRDQRFRYTRNWMPFRPYGQYIEYLWRAPTTMAWEEAWKAGEVTPEQAAFFNPSKPAEELYDCLKDPDNIHNLVDDPSFQATLSRMREALDHWILQTRDAGLLPEGEFMQRIEKLATTGYELVRSEAYPLSDLLHAANLASTAGPDDLPELNRLAGHDDSGVRYWVATAFLNMEGDCEEVQKLLGALLDDPSVDVRIAAAEALYRRGQRDVAKEVLEAALGHPQEMVRVHALNVLAFADSAFVAGFQPLLESLGGEVAEGRGYDLRAAAYLLERLEATSSLP